VAQKAEIERRESGAAAAVPALRKAAARIGGARLVYGKPVREGKHTVVPVASVRAAGGGGFGNQGDEGGGGGAMTAQPVGFIEVSADGARFRRIVTGADVGRALAGAAALGAVALAARRDRALRPRAYAALFSRRR
jgi:hypothetical protein